jgi:hypothetical protein
LLFLNTKAMLSDAVALSWCCFWLVVGQLRLSVMSQSSSHAHAHIDVLLSTNIHQEERSKKLGEPVSYQCHTIDGLQRSYSRIHGNVTLVD